MQHSLAAKSFIVNDKNELLLIKRPEDVPHCPGVWEVPGGRLNKEEDPFEGLKREVKEETGIEIDIKNPLKVHHFTRQDSQKITMITFLCKPITTNIVLSKEHVDYEWISADKANSKLHHKFHKEVEILKKHFLNKV